MIATKKMKSVFKNEVSILKRIGDHEGVLCFVGAGEYGDRLGIVTKFIHGIELYHAIKTKNFTNRRRLEISLELSEIISYIHHRNIIHLDLKLNNILYDSDGKLWLVDFGFSCYDGDELDIAKCIKSKGGTLSYTPAEVWKNNIKNFKMVDIYSLGIIFALIAGIRNPYYARDSEKLKQRVITGDYDSIASFNLGLDSLITDMINCHYSRRPDIDTVIKRLKFIIKTYPF